MTFNCRKLAKVGLSLVFALTLALSACGSTDSDESTGSPDMSGFPERGDNEIAALYDEGFTINMTSYDEDTWNCLMMKEDSYDVVYRVKADMGAENYELLSSLSWDDENYDKKQEIILTNLTGVKVEDISDMVPTQEELDEYVGKTLGDLEADGFENSGNTNSDGVYSFWYDGPVYCVKLDLAEGMIIEDFDDYSPNDLRKLEIGAMEFCGFSSVLLDSGF